jgi:Tfp pilus assembly protein FimT
MAMLLIVLSLTAPSLSVFFRGRVLDSEARRFMTLTRYGQSRAVSEGVPMVLWINAQQKRYGLEAEFTSAAYDSKSVDYPMSEDLEIEVEAGQAQLQTQVQSPFEQTPAMAARNRSQIRFTPDGFISDSSPRSVRLRNAPRDGTIAAASDTLWISQTRNRLSYEVQSTQPFTARR